MSALEWTRPLGFLGLLLPVLVLLASRRLERPVETATGTLDLWRRVIASRPATAPRARRRIPLAVWLLAAGLALGALALAGPRRTREDSPRLRVVVDGSPSMELPLGAGTRRDRALELERRWIEEHFPRNVRMERFERTEPFGPGEDRADTLWVTDAVPDPRPERAGYVASGGPAVPGPIAVDGSTRYDWDGERIVAVPEGAPKRIVAISGEPPKPIADVWEAWVAARGVVVGAMSDRNAVLRFQSPVSGSRRDVEIGRDGWKAKATVVDIDGVSSAWLEDAEHRTVVEYSPGRIGSAIAAMEDPSGDPAAFAVSWAKLFDDCALAPPGIVALEERRAAGDEVVVAPRGDRTDGSGIERSSWDVGLAFAAALCVALAAGLARSGRME